MLPARFAGLAIALAVTALALTPGASEPAAAIPEPIECHTGIDGSTICDVRVAGCHMTVVFRPDGSVSTGPLDC